MKIEIKNVKINKMFSEETICFKADVYINGKKIAYAENDGHGGSTFYNAYDIKDREVLKDAEQYATNLPSIKNNYGDKTYEFPMTLEHIINEAIDDVFNGKEKAKQEKKIQKLMENHIVYGVPNSDTYHMIGFKGKQTFNQIGRTPQGLMAIKNLHNRIKKELKDGEVIFNTNL
jgi:hypothetical protein